MNSNQPPIGDELKRYAKQIRFQNIGVDGQSNIGNSHVVVIGCGALGSVSANLLARAGVGHLTIIDRDFVELDNLQRQVLYDESDIGKPKAIVSAQKLRKVNSQITVDGHVSDVNYRNIESFVLSPRADVIVDGTDNFEIRFLINDSSIKNGIPWIYGGCLGSEGHVMSVLPEETGCLNCLMIDGPPAPGTTATCDSNGVLSTIINLVASLQVNETLKLISGNKEQVSPDLQVFDLWSNRTQKINLKSLREQVDCPACKYHKFNWLSGELGSQTSVLCGRNAVQLSFPESNGVDLQQLDERLKHLGKTESNGFMVRFSIDGYVLNVFNDGRAIINGTEDINFAKKLYAQYIGG